MTFGQNTQIWSLLKDVLGSAHQEHSPNEWPRWLSWTLAHAIEPRCGSKKGSSSRGTGTRYQSRVDPNWGRDGNVWKAAGRGKTALLAFDQAGVTRVTCIKTLVSPRFHTSLWIGGQQSNSNLTNLRYMGQYGIVRIAKCQFFTQMKITLKRSLLALQWRVAVGSRNYIELHSR